MRPAGEITLYKAATKIVPDPLFLRQTILSALADPNVAFVTLLVGILAIYAEFCAPGRIAPGVLGGISVLLALSALANLPINWVGVALLLLAAVLFVAEAKMSLRGMLAAAGAMAMASGAVVLVDRPLPGMRIHWSTALGVSLPFAAVTVFLLKIAVRARYNKFVIGGEARR